jgi:transposase InsO family protein
MRYREEGLAIRSRSPKRRRAATVREERFVPTAPNQSWAMDFMHDLLTDGTKIRLLTIVDNYRRESLPLEPAYGFKSPQVVSALSRLVAERCAPRRIQCDNEPKCLSLELDRWAYWNRVKLDFSRPGRPSNNAFCESFSNRVRQELLNPNWFKSLLDVQVQGCGLASRLQCPSPAQFGWQSRARRVRQASEEASIINQRAAAGYHSRYWFTGWHSVVYGSCYGKNR